MKRSILAAFSVLILVTLACVLIQVSDPQDMPGPSRTPTTDHEPSPASDPAQGELLFSGQGNGDLHCSVCHSLQPDQTLVGPSLAGIATRAASRMEGYSAEEYLRESILQPNAYIVEGFRPDIMPENLGKRLNGQQLADLIAYLMTLK